MLKLKTLMHKMLNKKKSTATNRLRVFNDVFSLGLVFFAIYILILPIVPQIQLWWKNYSDSSDGYVYETNLVTSDNGKDKADDGKNPNRKPIPKDNRLVLPQIKLNEAIHDGPSFAELSKGPWLKPVGSTPDQGGNTVIVGHRFTYSDPAVFYHLDKIKEGDTFPIYWEGKEYDYKVSEIKIVSPNEVSVEAPTEEPMVTIYTCTPIWTSENRLVIRAKLINPNYATRSSL